MLKITPVMLHGLEQFVPFFPLPTGTDRPTDRPADEPVGIKEKTETTLPTFFAPMVQKEVPLPSDPVKEAAKAEAKVKVTFPYKKKHMDAEDWQITYLFNPYYGALISYILYYKKPKTSDWYIYKTDKPSEDTWLYKIFKAVTLWGKLPDSFKKTVNKLTTNVDTELLFNPAIKNAVKLHSYHQYVKQVLGEKTEPEKEKEQQDAVAKLEAEIKAKQKEIEANKKQKEDEKRKADAAAKKLKEARITTEITPDFTINLGIQTGATVGVSNAAEKEADAKKDVADTKRDIAEIEQKTADRKVDEARDLQTPESIAAAKEAENKARKAAADAKKAEAEAAIAEAEAAKAKAEADAAIAKAKAVGITTVPVPPSVVLPPIVPPSVVEKIPKWVYYAGGGLAAFVILVLVLKK